MRNAFVAIVALLLFSSCSLLEDSYRYEIDDPSLSHNPGLLVGTWEWTHSNFYGTEGGQRKETPESTERTEAYAFLSDGQVQHYYNGELHREGGYEIILSGQSIQLFGGMIKQFGVSHRKLVLSTAATDGPEQVFKRIQEDE